MPMIALSGVLISWETVETNWRLARFAASARCNASFSRLTSVST